MNLKPMDLGVCGVEQLLHAGKVSFDTKDIANGVELIELPANMIITKAVAVVGKAFNAATTNVLTVGTNDSVDDLLGADDVTEGTAGTYMKNIFEIRKGAPIKVKAKYTSTGTAATAGEANIYLGVVRIPE
ncbi:hypothetical protein B5E53_07190 [Eubacterium sp. An11]|uniref:hypothetical protein n=1 Tax=Eubacterium sp. An11 TaxID=1965542 RepID=UPI000B3A0F7C|nr:hypothetical protein [Eubacterium sp. An11]OUQ68246.1 hypothetical protein B5E53_07190 [Eubacterium sp. An11]